MTSIATKARAVALQVEAKKHALRQQQDGCWILTMKVHQNDMPSEIMKAAMGQRYVCALVAVDENEQPVTTTEVQSEPPRQSIPRAAGAHKERRSFSDLSPAQQAGILANEAAFGVFLREKFDTAWMTCFDGDSLQTAASTIRYLCDVDSRRELTRENAKWTSLVLAYRLWQQEPSVVPA